MARRRSSEAEGQTKVSGLGIVLSGPLLDAIGATVRSRTKYWGNPRRKPPAEARIAGLIAATVDRLSPASGRDGRPCKMGTLLPEVVTVVAGQAEMTCDVAIALGKPQAVSTELVVGLLWQVAGSGSSGLLARNGEETVLTRAAPAFLREALGTFVERAVVPVLKAVAGDRCPVGRAAAMAAWTRHVTRQLGEQATEVLSREVRWSSDEPRAVAWPPRDDTNEWAELRMLVLTNLMKADRHILSEELEHVGTALATSGLSPDGMARVQAALASPVAVPVDPGQLADDPAEALLLMLELVALARRDGQVRPSERAYVRDVGRQLGYAEEDVAALIEG